MTRKRGIVSMGGMPLVMADVSHGEPSMQDINSAIERANQAFAGFRQRNEDRLDTLERAVEGQIADFNARRLGGGVGDDMSNSGLSRLVGSAATDFHAALRGLPSAAMTTQSDPDGGFTVAPEVDRVMDALVRDISPMRGLARVVTINTGDAWEKIITRTGSQSAWVGEEEERTDTDSPVLGKVSIRPNEIYALPELTNHVLEDSSFDLNAFVEEDVAGEFALTESSAFVSGDGFKKPTGFLSGTPATSADATRAFGTLQYVATGQSGAFASSNPVNNLHDLLTALKPAYRTGPGVAWLMNSTTGNAIRKFKDSTGRPLWTDSLVEGQPDRLLGYAVAFDEAMPDIAADTFSVAFGNWRRGYAIVEKPGLRLIVDRLTKKGWTKLYFSKRVGGGVVDSNAIKLLKFAAS